MPLSYLLALAGALILAVSWRWVKAWWTFRGDRVVTCPENQMHAGVKVDALHAGGALRLRACSRWPEKAGCGQECLRQIEAAPEGCLVRTIADQWYSGRSCVSCGRPIGPVQWGPSQPALMSVDKRSVEWKEVPADHLFETLEVSAPLCFACHLANTLVREHPELAIERSRPNS
jgi:hypothetical protein